jgi:hypothetical protein
MHSCYNCIVMAEWVPSGQIVNQHYYTEVLTKLHECVRRKTPELWRNRWIVHQDNTPAHNTFCTRTMHQHTTHFAPGQCAGAQHILYQDNTSAHNTFCTGTTHQHTTHFVPGQCTSTQHILHQDNTPAHNTFCTRTTCQHTTHFAPGQHASTLHILHQDNTPAHNTLSVKQFLANKNITVLEYPPHSPDLTPCDFYLFPNIKSCSQEPILCQ